MSVSTAFISAMKLDEPLATCGSSESGSKFGENLISPPFAAAVGAAVAGAAVAGAADGAVLAAGVLQAARNAAPAERPASRRTPRRLIGVARYVPRRVESCSVA